MRVDLPALVRRPRPSAELVACYRDEFTAVWRALLRLGVRRADCDDAAQEVFVTAHRRWATLRDPSKRRPWLFAIVRRVAWRARRGDDRRERRHTAYADLVTVPAALDDALADDEAWSALARFLDTLDEEKRVAFVLGELEEMSRTELGEVLGINSNTAYSRLSAARRAFLAHFAGFDDDRLARLIVHASEGSEPAAVARSRSWAGIVAVIGQPLVASTKIAVLGSLALGGVIATGTIAMRSDERTSVDATVVSPPRERGPQPEPAAIVAAAPPRAAATAAAPPAPPPTVHVAHAAATAPTPTVDDEVRVLVAARAALARGDLQGAQRKLDEHRDTFGARAELHAQRERIAHDLAAAMIDAKKSGDSIMVEPAP